MATKFAEPMTIGGQAVRRGESRDIALEVSQTSLGVPINLLVRVVRARKVGPVLFVCGAVHGDELNGTAVIRDLMLRDLRLARGTLILVPVLNVFGFDRHTRYLPDRRDLNRCFPGHPGGNMAFRLAHAFYEQVIKRSDYGIDLHTATQGRINFPHVRGDLADSGVGKLARCFGCQLLLDRKGHQMSVRQVATESGCSAINFEAGEALRISRPDVELGVRGVLNALSGLRMIESKPILALPTIVVRESVWARAHAGGLLRFSVRPGDIVEQGAHLASCDSFFRSAGPPVRAPVGGIVLGMGTLPVVRPGAPVCHIGIPDVPVGELVARLRKDRVVRRASGPRPRVRSGPPPPMRESLRPSPTVERPNPLRTTAKGSKKG
ncbi:MAG: succinylglutamate desuccinylase/aspartoacylase family protein [Polyangiaceae bacterium]|nr:succinylglutamate desuccinylase/aspartoacylase family protein [Polyangiaceae bacterium]